MQSLGSSFGYVVDACLPERQTDNTGDDPRGGVSDPFKSLNLVSVLDGIEGACGGAVPTVDSVDP